MTTTELLITIAVSIAANLLTPAVRTTGARLAVYTAMKLMNLSRAVAKVRLRQLQDESAAIEALHARPIYLANRIAYYTVPQVLSLWLITVGLLYVLFSASGATLIHSTWAGGILGLMGYASRYPIGALFALSDLRKVTDIEGFRASNSNAQFKIISVLKRP